MINSVKFILSCCFLSFISCTCSKSTTPAETTSVNTDLSHLKFSISEAADWSNLFLRTSGWFGGDGIFAIPANGVDTAGAGKDQETLLLFSDTVIGEIVNDSLQPGFKMIHNSAAIIKGNEPLKDNIQFYFSKKADGSPESIFIPSTPNSKPGEYYWLGDGFTNVSGNGATYVFGYRIKDTTSVPFNFVESGNTLIKIPKGSKPPFTDQVQMDTPFFLTGVNDTNGSFGACIFANTKEAEIPAADGFIYVYGVRGKTKNVIVARVKPEQLEDFVSWRFWDGTTWNPDIKSVANIADRASNELSVTYLKDGRYAMVFQVDGISKTVGLRLSNHPEGPFGPIINLWDCQEPAMARNVFVYNAKVHSNLSQPGELLISYNVNSFDFFKDILKYPNLYRPRFLRVKLL